jgi:hypothetical protein
MPCFYALEVEGDTLEVISIRVYPEFLRILQMWDGKNLIDERDK